MIENDMNSLKESIVAYASFAAKMIEESIVGLVEKDEKILSDIVSEYEARANNIEIEVEEKCIEFIAKYEPKARNLRTTLMIMKINNDLERIGDEAVNIAESALFLIKKPAVKKLIDIPRMADEGQHQRFCQKRCNSCQGDMHEGRPCRRPEGPDNKGTDYLHDAGSDND